MLIVPLMNLSNIEKSNVESFFLNSNYRKQKVRTPVKLSKQILWRFIELIESFKNLQLWT